MVIFNSYVTNYQRVHIGYLLTSQHLWRDSRDVQTFQDSTKRIPMFGATGRHLMTGHMSWRSQIRCFSVLYICFGSWPKWLFKLPHLVLHWVRICMKLPCVVRLLIHPKLNTVSSCTFPFPPWLLWSFQFRIIIPFPVSETYRYGMVWAICG